MIILTILLFFQFNTQASAQLDRLRRSQTLERPLPAETLMVLIPQGPFEMGAAGTQALEDERPLHRVTLDAFMMDVHEVPTDRPRPLVASYRGEQHEFVIEAGRAERGCASVGG